MRTDTVTHLSVVNNLTDCQRLLGEREYYSLCHNTMLLRYTDAVMRSWQYYVTYKGRPLLVYTLDDSIIVSCPNNETERDRINTIQRRVRIRREFPGYRYVYSVNGTGYVDMPELGLIVDTQG